jgi:hypothetical protein
MILRQKLTVDFKACRAAVYVWQCERKCAAVRAAMCDSARGIVWLSSSAAVCESVREYSVRQCGSVYGSVRQCVAVCGSVTVCGSASGGVWQCAQ